MVFNQFAFSMRVYAQASCFATDTVVIVVVAVVAVVNDDIVSIHKCLLSISTQRKNSNKIEDYLQFRITLHLAEINVSLF